MKYATKVDLKRKKKLPTKGSENKSDSGLSRLEIAAKNRTKGRNFRSGISEPSRGELPKDGDHKESRFRDRLNSDTSTLFQMPEFSWESLKSFRLSSKAWKRIKMTFLVVFGIFAVTGIIGGLWLYSYIQELDQDLPSRESFFPTQELSSVVYDRNGVELAKFVGDRVAKEVSIKDIPEHVKWSFLAAEDIDFYTHQGFDATGIAYCGTQYVLNGGTVVCGGSTITQQLVKLVIEDTDVTVERKLREMLMAIKVEQAYTKDEILELYLSVAGFGGNIYGITAASEFYYDKDVGELTLAQAAILASIVQSPAALSPTLGLPDRETSQAAVKRRQEGVVLAQMRRNITKINDQTRINYDDQELDDVITIEDIDAALEEELIYEPPIVTEWRAGHFVDLVKLKLQTENYKYGEEPFEGTELANGGYKIFTTLDWSIQELAEQSVADAVKSQKKAFRVNNAAMVLTVPKTGEVITMVGSKNYYSTPEGCNKNERECSFDPQVNILLSKQSPGSSTKPFGFYEAYRQGLIFTGSFLPDIPVTFNDGFTIKNYNNKYNGVGIAAFASQQLQLSRNLPAVMVLEAIGIERFLEVMRTFGYSTYEDSSQYGYSAILGGSDVIPLEHAQGYGVFASGGKLVKTEVILRIEDREGNVVYEHKPKGKRVADEKAVFLTNQSLVNTFGIAWDNKQISGKSGTSENATDLWFSAYSPDFVAIAWMGNNNNKPLHPTANGAGNVLPWLKNFLRQIDETEYLKASSKFRRPAGVKRGGGCGETNQNNCAGEFVGMSSGWMIEEFDYPVDNIRGKIRVCKNQQTRLARPIDEFFDNARNRLSITYSMPFAPHWETFLVDYMDGPKSENGYEGLPNGGPSQSCTKTYEGSAETGIWISETNITDGMNVSPTLNIQGTAFTLEAGAELVDVTVRFDSEILSAIPIVDNNFDGTVEIPVGFDNGTYTITLTAKDTENNNSVETYSVILGGRNSAHIDLSIPSGIVGSDPDFTVSISAPPPPGNNTVTVQIDYSTYSGGKSLTGEQLCISEEDSAFVCSNVGGSGPVYVFDWSPTFDGTDTNYRIFFKATMGSTGEIRSANVSVLVDETL